MKFKQFLKPDWRKIVIFILGDLIALYFSFNIFQVPVMCGLFNCYSFPDFNMIIIFMTFFMILWYLISCLIIWIYDRSRKVKKK